MLNPNPSRELIPFASRPIGDETVPSYAGLLTTAVIAHQLDEFVQMSYRIRTVAEYRALRDAVSKHPIPASLYYLRDAVLTHVFWIWERGFQPTEKALVKRFKEQLPLLLPGAKIVPFKIIRGHHPDCLIQIHEELLPVEVKLDAFNRTALSQLSRYIKVYKAKQGIAVAPQLTCRLPSHIRFVELDYE